MSTLFARWRGMPLVGMALLLVGACFAPGCAVTREPAAAYATNGVHVDAARQAHADRWNAVFEKKPGAGYGWSGGDAAISVALPFCRACPPGSRYRRLWLFGDSAFSTVDDEGFRVNAGGERGADYAFGNVAAITAHAGPSGRLARSVSLDYGAKGYRSTSWMPLLLEPRQLPDMDPLRIAAAGYRDLGFSRTPDAVAGVYSLPELAPEALRSDLVAVHEYYDPAGRAIDYDTRDPPLRGGSAQGDGYEYRRIAFYVHRTQQKDTVPLYRQGSASRGDLVLRSSRDAAGAARDAAAGELLGYVYVPASGRRNVHALVEYSRVDSARAAVQRVYTTRPNDDGKDVLMWPKRGLVIGTDLVQVFAPVTPLDLPGMVPWDDVEKTVVSIVRGVDRPYARWGKTRHGDWSAPPQQFELVHSNARTSWGHALLADPDFTRNHYVYVYGVRMRKLVVARVACRDASDFVRFENWRFYSDGEWVASQDDATPIADYAATEFSVHQTPAGRFALIQSPPGLVPAIAIAVAPSPAGPFRPGRTLELSNYRNEIDRHRRYSYYAAGGHDGLAGGGRPGGMLISYVRSCAFSADAACKGRDGDENRADVYVPRFIDLPWSAIDP